jgi:hypothetical protein
MDSSSLFGQFVMRGGRIIPAEGLDYLPTLSILSEVGETPQSVGLSYTAERKRFAPTALNTQLPVMQKPIRVSLTCDIVASTACRRCIDGLPFHEFPRVVDQQHRTPHEHAQKRITDFLHGSAVVLVGIMCLPENIHYHYAGVGIGEETSEPLLMFRVGHGKWKRLDIGVGEDQVWRTNVVPAVAQLEDTVAPYKFARIQLKVKDFLRCAGVTKNVLPPAEAHRYIQCQERFAGLWGSEEKDQPGAWYEVLNEPSYLLAG